MVRSARQAGKRPNGMGKGAGKRRKPVRGSNGGGRGTGFTGLDTAAATYARLVRDPCNAPLTRTIWPGSGGALVSRFETDFISFAGATETAAAVAFVPGVNQLFYNSTAATADTTATTLTTGALVPPGSTFLSASAGTIRCVAACLQISYPGTELNRSGIVSLGVVPFGTLLPNVATSVGGGNTNTSVSQLRTLCQHTERMPQNHAEVTWFPGSGDTLPFATQFGSSGANIAEDAQNKNALVATMSGFPVGVGVRIRLVYVCEWTPRLNQGQVATAEVPASRSSLNDVLIALHKTGGTNWFINSWQKASPYLKAAGSVISYGAKMLGPAMAAL